jgi:hypothetical protein
MNRGRISAQFFLAFLMMTLLIVMGCSKSEDAFQVASSAPVTYSISGAVSGYAPAGVTINLTGAATTSATTDALGAFTITGLASGEYTITPVKTGSKFTPSSAAVTVSGANVTVPDFVAASDSTSRYSISGTVNGAVKYQVLITLTGAGSATTKTDTNGNYTFSNLVGGIYTITPTLAGYTFSSQLTPTLGPSITGQNFTAGAVGVSYAQDDLTGTWNMNILRKGTARKEWERFRISVDSGGVASCIYHDSSTKVLTAVDTLQDDLTIGATSFYITNGAMPAGTVIVQIGDEKISGTFNSSTREITSCVRGYGGTTAAVHSAGNQVTEIRNNPTGETTCPSPFTLTFTMGAGVVTPSGTTASDLGISHMTMTSSKKLIAGTGTSTDSSYQLAIMQKEAIGTLSAALDSSSTSFYVNNLTMPSGSTIVQIDSEKISGTYNSVTHQFTDCTRGYNSTTAASHLLDAEVALVYSLADVQNKNFVYHQLQFGKIDQWERAVGQTDADGAIRLTSLTSPSGAASDMPKALGVSFIMETATGRVDMSGTIYASFEGFLSDDKKTIVGTYTDNITDPSAVDTGQNDYHLIVFQMEDQIYPAGALPAGTSVAHLLGIGSQFGWGYFTTTVASGGGMTFSVPTTDNISFTLPITTSGSISASGIVTIAGISSYHGQMSYDGKFIVGIWTLASGVYTLQIDTK